MLRLHSNHVFTLKGQATDQNGTTRREYLPDSDLLEEVIEQIYRALRLGTPVPYDPGATANGNGHTLANFSKRVDTVDDPPHKRKKVTSSSTDDGRTFVDVIQITCTVLFKAEGNWRQSMKANKLSSRLLDLLDTKCNQEKMLALDISNAEIRLHSFDASYNNNMEYNNIVTQATNLSSTGRVKIDRSVQLLLSPLPQAEDELDLPFSLIITELVSLVTPDIFDPPELGKSKHYALSQLKFLSDLFHVRQHRPDNFKGSVDMSFFVSSMKQAPPLPSLLAEDAAQPESLRPCLLPFQRNSVGWLLEREGKVIGKDGKIACKVWDKVELPLFWEQVKCVPDQPWYFNTLTGQLLPHRPPDETFFGGILAEEPGLGKTLESIALVLLNPATDRVPSRKRWDPIGKLDVREVKTTLIVTPDALQQQWIDEIATHAPHLKVMVYRGWNKDQFHKMMTAEALKPISMEKGTKRKRASKSKSSTPFTAEADVIADEMGVPEWASKADEHDIWVTTYTVLAHELPVARAPIVRPRRETATYSNKELLRSPLVRLEWYRVIMDEVQMVGGGKTEEMVSLIPRISSYAVSGTPARSRVDDLIHVLKFLRVGAVVNSPVVWSRLQEREYAQQFAQLFGRIGIRTVKAKVQDQLTIPEQQRFVVPIDLGRVERQVYNEAFDQALKELGLSASGVASLEGWEVDAGVLRNWIRRLRGLCTHPLVGQLTARQVDDLRKPGALKTIGEVLETMKEMNMRQLLDDRKTKIQNTIRRARLTQQDSANLQRYRVAVKLLLTAKEDMEVLCNDLKVGLAEQEAHGETLKREAAARRPEKSGHLPVERIPDPNNKGKQRMREESVALTDDSMNEGGLPKTPAGDECRRRMHSFQSRLRECEIVLHQIHFFLGDTYNILGDTTKEETAYADADDIRKRLLRTTEQVAVASMNYLKNVSDKKAVTKREMMIDHCGKGGIRSDHLLREADVLITILNEQTELLFEWRQRIFGLLTEEFVKGEDEKADGEEFSRSLETQGVAEILLQEYTAVIADRREVMLLERSALAAHDTRERKVRNTLAARKAADIDDVPMEQLDLEPEHEVLKAELSTARKELLKNYEKRALRSIVADLMHVVHKDDDPEKVIAREYANLLRRLIVEQGKLHDRLEADLAQFRKTFNDRILYFRQLQELSDSVTPVEWQPPLADAIQETHTEETRLDSEINQKAARQRYLTHLASNANDDPDDEENSCILCKCDFIKGYITQCAHVFCEECFKAWTARREGKACPVCRAVIDLTQLQRISMAGGKKPEKEEPSSARDDGPAPKSSRVIEYNNIDPYLFEEIEKVESNGSYGSKIQSIVRHLLYIENKQPGSKSIVFTAWAHSLHILEHALSANGISCVRIDQKRGKENAAKVFRTDPNIMVLLLHGERENAGLNVTCASRVFLVEPVVHYGFEIQGEDCTVIIIDGISISRIDRMGQTRPTEVYCYYAEDTVEKSILDLGAKRGVSLYTKGHAMGTLNVTSLDMDAKEGEAEPTRTKTRARDKRGDFHISADDMLAILFPHLFEDIEYLVPAEGEEVEMYSLSGDFEHEDSGVQEQETPIAGPSRLGR